MQEKKIASVITVMLVDDHAVVRQGIESFLSLQQDICVVAQSSSGEQAIEMAAEYVPDVILMDLIMPGGMGGIEATREIKATSPHTQVIVLTSYHDDEHIFPAIQAGALSYVLKEVYADDLVSIIRMAARGEAHMSPQVASRLLQNIQQPKGDVSKNNKMPLMALTEREQQILQSVAAGLSNAEMCEQLCLSIKTVRTHVSNILSKLHLRDRTQVAIYAWREGLIK
jgi:NarL family two-component system response regulator LiaR